MAVFTLTIIDFALERKSVYAHSDGVGGPRKEEWINVVLVIQGPQPGPLGSRQHNSCNYLQNVVAIAYMFVLELPTFPLCNIHTVCSSLVKLFSELRDSVLIWQ